MADQKQRQFIRIKVSRDVEFATGGGLYHGFITDEGSGGIFIQVKGIFCLGNRVKMTYVTHQSIQVTRNGNIVRVQPEGIAIAFDDPHYAR